MLLAFEFECCNTPAKDMEEKYSRLISQNPDIKRLLVMKCFPLRNTSTEEHPPHKKRFQSFAFLLSINRNMTGNTVLLPQQAPSRKRRRLSNGHDIVVEFAFDIGVEEMSL